MTVPISPEIQAQYDQNAAEDRAAVAAVAGELSARREELAKQIAATNAELAELGEKMAGIREAEPPRPVPKSIEDNDISAKAEDYQEPDEDTGPAPKPAARQAAREPEDDLSDHDWLE
jgi:hypothetical protein